MKKVWVNRFNADGSMKPMNDWELIEVPEHIERVTTYINPEKAAKEIAADTGLDAFFTQETKSEDVSDQRGDGWLYVADGHLPPINEAVLAYSLGDNKVLSVESNAVILTHKINKNATSDEALIKIYPCWQPITPPKFLD